MKEDINNCNIGKLKNKLFKKERLNGKNITNLFKNCRKLKREDYLGIYERNCLSYPRLAVSLKRKSGKAVYRNYERRIVKEIFRTNKIKLPNVDILIVKLSSNRVTFKEKKQDLINLFKQIKKRSSMIEHA